MSIASPPKPSATASPSGSARVASEHVIHSRIEEACRALWRAELVRTVLGMVVFSITALLIWVVIDQWIYSPGRWLRLAAFLGMVALIGRYLYVRVRPLIGSTIRPEYAARSLERDMPELRQALTSYVTLQADRDAGDLRSRVVRSIGASTASRLRGHDALPIEATGTLRWWVATASALAVLVAYAAFSPKNTLQSAARLAAPIAAIDPPLRVSIREVKPGDSEAIAGRSVEISAEIDGLRSGEEAVCHWELPAGRQEFALVRDPDSRRFSGPLALPHSAGGVVRYTLWAGDATAGPFELTVQDVPVVALESVHYTPPKYTGQTPYRSSNGAITALDGSTVKIVANTNRAIDKAKIEFNPRALGNRMQATAGATEMEIDATGTALSVAFPLRSAYGRSAAVELEDYRILVWDASDQGNPDPIIYPIRVVPDLPPEVAITVPASSPKEVPIDAQQIIEVHASDPDYGLKSISLEIRAGIDLVDEPVLWSSEAGEKGHRVAEFRLRPTALQLRIGDTVQVVAIATDNRSSDLYPNVEANVVRTDPVTLRITAGGDLPEPNDPSADGLSSPEPDSGKSEQSKQNSSGDAGDSGGKGSGGSGGESGDSANAGETGQQQSGGGGAGSDTPQQSEGNQAGGQQGEGGDQNESGQNESGQNESGTGNESGKGSSDGGGAGGEQSGSSDASEGGQEQETQSPGSDSESNSGSGTGSEGASSDSSNSGNAGGNAGTGKDSGGAEPPGQPQGGAQNDPRGAGDPSGASDPNRGTNGEADSNTEAGSDQTQQGQGSSRQGSSSGADSTGQDNSARGPQNAGESASPGEPSGSQTGSQGDQGNAPKQAPKHDGEAFERIQDYLEKNRNQGSQDRSSNQGTQGQGTQGQGNSGPGNPGPGNSGPEQCRSGQPRSGLAD